MTISVGVGRRNGSEPADDMASLAVLTE